MPPLTMFEKVRCPPSLSPYQTRQTWIQCDVERQIASGPFVIVVASNGPEQLEMLNPAGC